MSVADKARVLRQDGRIQILFGTDQLVQGRVRGDHGVYDVRWTRLQGWSCSCVNPRRCSHVEAVSSVTMRSVGGCNGHAHGAPALRPLVDAHATADGSALDCMSDSDTIPAGQMARVNPLSTHVGGFDG